MVPLRIAFIASEASPFAKSGGLADVAGTLPRHLRSLGCDVRVFIPQYARASAQPLAPQSIDRAQGVPVKLSGRTWRFSLLESRLPDSDVPVYFVNCPEAFGRPSMYTSDADEHARFLVLQRAVLESCQRLPFAPHVFHCNDWHTGLIPLLLKTDYAWDQLFAPARTLMTIHNIGYQGVFAASSVADLGAQVATHLDVEDAARGKINWLREGLRHADRVSTVSPTYAWEICTPLGGHGLEETLRARGDSVAGILNGVNYDEWSPEKDRYLQHHFSVADISGKADARQLLLRRMQLAVSDSTPVIGMVSRLTIQKGIDLLFDTLPQILAGRDCALVVLGSGDPPYERFFRELQQRFAPSVRYVHGYDDELSHLIEAGSDMFLMPSMYEPCGLNQMYSLKYGTVPVVRRTGGLADTVQPWDAASGTGTGIVFEHYDTTGLLWALNHALDLYRDKHAWMQIMRNGMGMDFSWPTQAKKYEELYLELALRKGDSG